MTITIRPSYVPHIVSAAVLVSAGSALFENGMVRVAFGLWALALMLIPLAVLDRLEFDGQAIRHRGPLALALSTFRGLRQVLLVSEIEAIITETTCLTFASGNARMSYRTRIRGAGFEIIVRSHRKGYARFVRALFKAAGPDKLDPRSFEIFEYFEGGKSTKEIPILKSDISAMPASALRRAANSLKLAGRMALASSYFRVAYEKEPRNAELLYEMSRFYDSSAQGEDSRLIQRSDACLRLASRLAAEEPRLLERIGEAFFQRFDYKRASDCFQRALTLDPARFRANVGLAEIALRDGKLAHVVHFYQAAARNGDAALARLAGREARYYERLVSDDDFLESEIRRIQAGNQFRWARRLAAVAFFGAWVLGGLAGHFYPAAEKFGWALMATSGVVWCIATAVLHFFRPRKS